MRIGRVAPTVNAKLLKMSTDKLEAYIQARKDGFSFMVAVDRAVNTVASRRLAKKNESILSMI